MPRTSPDIDGAPSTRRLTLRFVDADGKAKAFALYADGTTTNVQMQTYQNLLGAQTNANLWAAEVSDIYEGNPDKSLAVNAVHVSIVDSIVYQMKASPTDSQRVYVPAPSETLFVSGTNNPDLSNADLSAIFLAGLAVVNGTGTDYSGVGARFSQGRQINQRTRT